VTLRELAELAFGRFIPSTAWEAWQLTCDGLYFHGTPDCITACSREEVSQKQEARRLKASQKIAWTGFLTRVANRQVTSEDDHFLAEVEAMALGEANKSRVLHELGRSQNPQNAHSLLLDLGRWNNRFNPHPKRFGAPLSASVSNLPELPEEDRVDLTHLPAFAIDNAWTTDPDDALSLEGPNRLWVHVADVAAIVPPDSPADIEARNRAASLYLPEMTVPMLPVVASERLALGISDISPALSFGLNLDSEGGIIGIEIVPSWVRVSRLSYEQAEGMFHDLPFEGLLRLAQNNEARRKQNGAVSIELPEIDVRVEDGKVVFHPVRSLRSQMIVREAMLMVCAQRGDPIRVLYAGGHSDSCVTGWSGGDVCTSPFHETGATQELTSPTCWNRIGYVYSGYQPYSTLSRPDSPSTAASTYSGTRSSNFSGNASKAGGG